VLDTPVCGVFPDLGFQQLRPARLQEAAKQAVNPSCQFRKQFEGLPLAVLLQVCPSCCAAIQGPQTDKGALMAAISAFIISVSIQASQTHQVHLQRTAQHCMA
jgi:hypothetical protein